MSSGGGLLGPVLERGVHRLEGGLGVAIQRAGHQPHQDSGEAFVLGQTHAALDARGDGEGVLGVEDSRDAQPAQPTLAVTRRGLHHGGAQGEVGGPEGPLCRLHDPIDSLVQLCSADRHHVCGCAFQTRDDVVLHQLRRRDAAPLSLRL
jgi:hypothetical protein